MSVYEEIINGTYKKKKESVYESIINGTYETQSQIAERKKQEQQQKLNKVSSYQNTKKTAMKQIGTQIKKQSEARKQQEEIINNEIKKQVNNINSNFNKENSQNMQLPTVKNTSSNKINNNSASNYRNTALQETSKKILPTKKDNKEASKSDIKVSSEPIKDISGITKSSDAFDDGYQFGDVSKTIGSTLANAGASFTEGIGRIGEGASDFGTHVAAQVVDWAGNKEWANRIRKTAIEDRNKELFDNIQNGIKGNSVLGNKGTETLASMGYSTGLMAFEMNPLTSKIGTGLMFSSASAGGLNDSYSKEGVTNTQAWIRGLGQGAIETAVERASGLFGSVGSWDRSLSNAISSRISSGFGKLLVRTGVQGLAEGSEEIVSYTLNKIFDKAINKVSNGKGATFSEEWNWEELGEQIGIAFLSASLMGMGSTAYEVGQIVNNDKLNLAQAINEAGLRSDVKAQAELLNEDIENIKKQLKKNPNNTELTNELKSKYAQMNELVTNNVFLQDKTNIKEDEAQLRLQEAQDIINNAQNGQGQANNTTNLQTQQTIQQENKTAQNQTSVQIENNYITEEFKQGIEKFNSKNYDQTDNIQVLNKLPQYFYNFGYEINQPLYLNMYKLKDIMKQPKGTFKGVNQHGITMDIIEQLPKALNNPLNVIKNPKFNNRFVIVTDLTDQYGDIIVVPVELKNDNNAEITSISKINSIYGKDTYDIPYKDENQSYMGKNKNNIVYDIDNERSSSSNYRLQLPSETKTTSTNSITPSKENVKPTNYSMQNEQNNTQNNEKAVNNNETDNREYTKKKDKTLNPAEIANFTEEDANTTPKLKQKHYAEGNKESSFYRNVTVDSKFLNKDLRQEMSKDENIRYYKGITNEETLEKAYADLQKGGKSETLKWFNKESNDISAEDVAKGWILLKQYQDSGDYQGAIEVAKKMRNMATRIGQAEQAYNILSRLTPEGMFYYAQSELSEAYEKMAQGKSKEWIDENKSKFDLTPEETQFIKEKMESIQGIEDERTKKVVLAEIQKVISDKIPPTLSQSVKAWMRISMLFNPKTQVRNVMGNAVILPVNVTSDAFSGALDRIIAKKTGVRTIGITKEGIKGYAKGFGKGLYESYDDFRRGINTRNIEGNRFEVTEGKSFKDKGLGKALNRADNMLSFMLDAGDRGFYEATFTNSINNQLVLNNTTEVTQEMIDIAINEALQRTWQDNNAYTNAVLKIRNILNFGKGYGLGDVLIPFAKTPANLTKAIVDYSPVGLTKTLAIDARKFNNSLKNGQYTAQMQHQFVQNFGKGMAGSFLYVLGYALAKAGIATGEADDDKDVKNFMKNSLGISSYSIKIGDKTFTYDWAQPVATPLAIMTNYIKYSKDNPDANALEKIWKSMNIGTEQLLQQSFMESLNTVLNGNGSTLENLSQAVLELPARAIPTFSKQIADMIDGTQRTSFEYDKPFQSAINSVKVKIPVLSKTLPASVDTLGNEIKKYGGDNNLWNVMFNPANKNKGQLSKAGEEIYNVYMQTGDTTIFPRTAPYYINSKGQKITMTAEERSEFQKITGKYVENTLTGLLNNKDYSKLSNEKKAEVINEIVSDSYAKAKYDILNIDSKEYKKLRDTLNKVSTVSYYDYKFKTKDMKKDKEKLEVLINSNYSNNEKQAIYENYIKSENDSQYSAVKASGMDITEYLKFKTQEFESDKKDDGTLTGKTINKSKQKKVLDYLNSMKITGNQRLLLYAMQGYTTTSSQKAQLANYVYNLKLTKEEKLKLYNKFSGFTVYKNGTVKW